MANGEPSLFARLKDSAKRIPFIYYPVHYTLSALRYTKSFLRWQAYKHTVKFNRNGLNTTEQRPRRIIASLTSYPARINIVPYVIASILNQTMKPDKIILWLAEPQFPDKKLPPIFDEVKACGVEVRFCPEDIRAHKKYFYAVKEFPEDIIITFDDDLVYRNFIIEKLYKSYIEHPECVSAMHIHKIVFLPDGNIASYTDWERGYENAQGKESYLWLPVGVGGIFYPPHCLSDEVFNVEALKKLCLHADDIWLKFAEVMNGTKVVPASNAGWESGWGAFGSQEFALAKSNVSGGGNDSQIKAVLEAYSDWRDPNGRTLLEVIREG